MSEFFEMLMIVSFGISWPISVYKSYRSRTANGKSVAFTYFIWIGYLFGIISKLMKQSLTYVFVFYIINLITVSADILLYYRNRRIDQQTAEKPMTEERQNMFTA